MVKKWLGPFNIKCQILLNSLATQWPLWSFMQFRFCESKKAFCGPVLLSYTVSLCIISWCILSKCWKLKGTVIFYTVFNYVKKSIWTVGRKRGIGGHISWYRKRNRKRISKKAKKFQVPPGHSALNQQTANHAKGAWFNTSVCSTGIHDIHVLEFFIYILELSIPNSIFLVTSLWQATSSRIKLFAHTVFPTASLDFSSLSSGL